MFKAVKLRLYPNQEQRLLLDKNGGCTRFIYNHFLDLNIKHYAATKKKLSYVEMCKELPSLKKEFEWLQEVDSTSLQQALKNLDQAYSNFFRRVKQGQKPGFPRFKRKGVVNSFRVVMSLGFESNYLRCGKHGWIKVRGSTELLMDKEIRSITISKNGSHWYAAALIEVEKQPHTHRFHACGIDLGVKRPLTVVYEKEGEPKSKVLGRKFGVDLKKKEERRKRWQRQLARKQKGSNNHLKTKVRLAKAYQKEKNCRKNFVEQTSHKLSSLFKVIVFEDLKLKNMTKSAKGTVENPGTNVSAKSGLNRELLRLGLGFLVARTEQKAMERGGLVILVNPRFTSQTCSECGTIDRKSRKNQATFSCISCGHTVNADQNAAINILNLGTL